MKRFLAGVLSGAVIALAGVGIWSLVADHLVVHGHEGSELILTEDFYQD